MKRINGYVVGRKSAHGISTWAVKVQQNGHQLDDQKLLVASIARGVILSNGLDVDFLTVERSGSSMATDVAPRGVASEGMRQMRKSTLKMATTLVASMIVVGSVTAWFTKPWELKPLKDQFLEFKVAMVMKQFETMSFVDMVPDSVVRQAVLDGIGGTFGARKALWDKHLCGPVWNDVHDGRIGNENSKCFDALYASGARGPDNFRYNKAGIPLSIAPAIESIRKTASEKARAYLRDPAQLEAFYNQREQVVLKALSELKPEVRQYYKGAIKAFEQYLLNPEIKEALSVYLKVEDQWLHGAEWKGAGVNPAYEKVDWARRNLEAVSGGYTEVAMFAGRREAEGGTKLLLTYARIGNNVRYHLEQMK